MNCGDCGAELPESAIKCRCGWKASFAKPAVEPMRTVGRSGYCDNAVCREIREAYRKSRAYQERNDPQRLSAILESEAGIRG